MRQGLALSNEMDYRLFAPLTGTLLAEREAEAGQVDAGLATLDAQLAGVEQTGERWFDAEMHRVRGELLLKLQRPDVAAAESAFIRAIEIARKQQTRTFELRAAMSMARLWRDRGKRQQARGLLASVYGWFSEGFDTLDLKAARTLLDTLGS
jgi:predicted ATPase